MFILSLCFNVPMLSDLYGYNPVSELVYDLKVKLGRGRAILLLPLPVKGLPSLQTLVLRKLNIFPFLKMLKLNANFVIV